jgi:hypothetical protein
MLRRHWLRSGHGVGCAIDQHVSIGSRAVEPADGRAVHRRVAPGPGPQGERREMWVRAARRSDEALSGAALSDAAGLRVMGPDRGNGGWALGRG